RVPLAGVRPLSLRVGLPICLEGLAEGLEVGVGADEAGDEGDVLAGALLGAELDAQGLLVGGLGEGGGRGGFGFVGVLEAWVGGVDRKSTRLNSSHVKSTYAV